MRRLFSLGVLVLIAAPALGQPNLPTLPQPRLQSIFPGGAKVGTTVEVTFTGTDLEEPEALVFSHSGIKADAIVPPTPPAPPVDPKKPAPKTPAPPPAKPPITKFKVTVSPGTPLGQHDVRFVNKWGVSNPRFFVVGDRNEIEEKEPNSDVAQAQKVELNSVVNGIINSPTDVDYFTFTGKKGQRVLLHVAASSIESRARPAVELYNAQGTRLAFNRNYRGNDALADLALPSDGEFTVRLYNFTHTSGNADNFYRLTLTTGPWIDAVVPPMIEPGKSAPVTLYGRNLPGGVPDPTSVEDGRVLEKLTVTIAAPADPLARQRLAFNGQVEPPQSGMDGFEYRFTGPTGSSNAVLMLFARAPVVLEKEPNDKPDAPQVVAAPCEIAGRLDLRNDRDWYAFNAKKGEVYMIDLAGELLGSPADFFLTVKPADPKAGPLAEQDDTNDSLHPFQLFTRSSDPQPFRFEAKEDGKYLILISARDVGTEYGPRHQYRLRIAPEKPDFRVIVMPDTPIRPEAGVLRAGGEIGYDVFVWRQDGFKEAVTLSAEGLPAGVTCPLQIVAPNQKQATLIFSAAAAAKPIVGVITVKGTATVAGQPLVREARPATISWATQQPNVPVISRLDRQLMIAVREKPPFKLTVTQPELKIKQGDKGTVNLKVARLWPDFKAQVAVTGPPGAQPNQPLIPGVQFNNNQPVNIAPDKTDGTATITVSTQVPPGVYSYSLRGTGQHQFEKEKGKKVNTGITMPAIPIKLIVIPKDLGSVSAAAGNLKVGGAGEVTIKVSRTNNYAGEFKVKFVPPAGTKGLTLADATIPAGKDEVKVPVKIAADVKPGAIQNIVVQATAMYDPQTPIVSETKINLNIVK